MLEILSYLYNWKTTSALCFGASLILFAVNWADALLLGLFGLMIVHFKILHDIEEEMINGRK